MPDRGMPTYWVDAVAFGMRDGQPYCRITTGDAAFELRGKVETLVNGLDDGSAMLAELLVAQQSAIVLPICQLCQRQGGKER